MYPVCPANKQEWVNYLYKQNYKNVITVCLFITVMSVVVGVWRKWDRCGCGLWAVHSLSLTAPLQSVGVEESERSGAAHRHRDPYHTYTAARPQPTDRQAAAEQHGAVSAVGWPGPAPQKSPIRIFTPSASFFLPPNMETTVCWLLLAAHFILICPQGKACCHSCFDPR